MRSLSHDELPCFRTRRHARWSSDLASELQVPGRKPLRSNSFRRHEVSRGGRGLYFFARRANNDAGAAKWKVVVGC